MLSDMVWGGAFHRHIITSGGRMATLARAVQLAAESTFPMMPAINAADTQRAARPALSDTSCMPEAYAAVAEQRCSGVHTCAAAIHPCPAADREGSSGKRSRAGPMCTNAQTGGPENARIAIRRERSR